jgi:hypothetical protein
MHRMVPEEISPDSLFATSIVTVETKGALSALGLPLGVKNRSLWDGNER